MFLLNILKSTLLASALLLTNAAHAQLAEVVSFTPQGETRRIQQVAVRFSADMVKLGESDAAVPVTLNCPQGNAESPTGRWVDTRRFVFEWTRDLPVGTRCIATLRTGVKTLEGRELKVAGPWEFTTGGPKLMAQLPHNGSSIREHETFLLRPDAPADIASVDQHLQCQAEGEAPLRMQRLPREDGVRAMQSRQ